MNVILIPCWKRPEFLHLCLDHLSKCEGIKDHTIIFRLDAGYDRDNLTVIDSFKDRLGPIQIEPTERTSYTDGKQSYSLLTGYHIAANLSDHLVYMIEEDVMVSPDFLKYHERVHLQEPNIFCSLSTKNHNRKVSPSDNPRDYYLTHLDYCSLGVCFKKEVIHTYLSPHLSPHYFRNPFEYVQATFPRSILNKSMCEQDGLIRRIQEQHEDRPIAYPHVPRAFHAGFYGYNRPQKVTGTLSERVHRCYKTIASAEAMKLASLSPAHYADSEPVHFPIEPWQTLTRHQPPELRSLGAATPS